MTRETAPSMIRIAAVLTDHADFLTENKIFGIVGIVDYITAPGYGHRYDADSPLPALAARIGRTGSRTAGARRLDRRTVTIREVSEDRMRTGNLLLDISNSITSLMTGGEPVGAVTA
jgi:hypothetical protein